MLRINLLALLTFVLAMPVLAQDDLPDQSKATRQARAKKDEQPTDPKSLTEKASYLIGHNVVSDFKKQEIDFDSEQLIRGILDAVADKKPDMSDEEIRSVMRAFERHVVKVQRDRLLKQAAENERAGSAFLKANALKSGVNELESGLQYQVLQEGSGESPKVTDRVKVHYKGSLIDGAVFESTLNGEPVSFKVGGVIRGFAQALQKMKVGDKWKLFIPGELAYGVQGRAPDIGPNQTLIFELELVEIDN